ncbi:MAG: class B sortase [Clostridia bacterium]|nr:class B sortase [Clostridia bacterium]
MDEDFVLKEDAVFEEEPSVNTKKENGFVKAVKNFIPWKGDNLSKILTKLLFAAIIVSLVVSSCYVGDFMVKYFQNKSIVDDARDKYDRNDDSVNDQTGVFNRYELLLQQNTDCVGWITVPNTNVDNPIYQTVNNDFYLDHNGIKEKSVYGAIFADYRDIISRAGNSKNITLYGHHMKDGSMFAQLHRYKTISFYKENPVITFDTIYGTGGQYKVFACMITNADNMDDNGYFFDFAAPSFRSDADFMSWIEQIRRRSLYNTAVDVNANDQILTLSTCTYEVKDADLLCVVVARKVRDGESVAVNTGDVTTNSKIIYPQAWYDHFKGVKPTYADGLYTWVSGDYDREDVNAPGSIAPESVVSEPTSSNTSSEAPVSSQAPTSSEAPASSTAPSQQLPTPTNPFTSSAEMQAPTPIAPLPTPIG